MVFYFVRTYVIVLALLTLLLMGALVIVRLPVSVAWPYAISAGSLLSAVLVYREFERRNIWPLYHNLRWTAHKLLIPAVLVVNALNAMLYVSLG